MFPSPEAASYYLAGVIDGEGSVTMRPFKTRAGHQGYARDVRVTNTDPDIIAATREALESLGIAYHVYERKDRAEQEKVFGRKPLSDVVVSHRDGVKAIHALVPLRCGYKLAKLQAIVGSYGSYGQLPDGEELARVFAESGDRGAAAHFGVSAGTIYNWRQKLGVGAGSRRRKKPPFDLEELACLLDQGVSLPQATEAVGVPYSTARYWIKQVAKDPEMAIGWVRRALLGEEHAEGTDSSPS